MTDQQQKKVTLVVIMAVLILVGPPIFKLVVSDLMEPSVEEARQKMKNYLYEKYGKEFVVDRIGTRSSRGEEFFQARIYPKEIVGTNKEGDDYYYASATVGKKSFGRLGDVGDSYPLVNLKLDIENYLMPKAKKIFGRKILMKIEAHYKRREPGNETYWGYKVKSFKKARKLIAEDPKNRMIQLELDVYIFKRIEDKQEKEARREDIFNFVQYLKKEGLFEYLEMKIFFVDERVLAPSYDKFARKITSSNKVKKEIEGQEGRTVQLPPMKLRERMSKDLQQEINEMNEKELLASMQEIKKDELASDGIGQNNVQHMSYIYSKGMMKEKYTSSYRENPESVKDYETIDDVEMTDNLEYVYIN